MVAGTVESTNLTAPSASAADETESPDVWVDKYGDLLYRTALARVANQTVAEDLVQEAFLAAWKGRATFDGRSELSTWLVAILRRKIADHFRSTGRSRETAPGDDEPGEHDLFDHRGVWRSPIGKLSLQLETPLEREEFLHVLQTCVQELPGNLAQAFSLRELKSTPPESVCEEIGISRQNLAVRLHRARLLLRSCLQGRWLGERKEGK